jgi:Putative bacterial sensory transduction regulator
MFPGLGQLETLRPLSNHLVTAVLDVRGDRYFTDDEGDVGGLWGENVIFFLVDPEGMLQIKGQVRREFTVEDIPRLYAFCNGWNHDRLWPKAYVHTFDDGATTVFGEVCTYLPHGVTIDQLGQLVECGIATIAGLADGVKELA